MAEIKTGEKMIVGSIIGAVIVFGLATIASKWFSDNYEWHGFQLVNKHPEYFKKPKKQ